MFINGIGLNSYQVRVAWLRTMFKQTSMWMQHQSTGTCGTEHDANQSQSVWWQGLYRT